jgi:hypothetical protein
VPVGGGAAAGMTWRVRKMEITQCTYCGIEIEGKGIQFRGKAFCGDECCEEFEAEFIARGEPKLDELAEDELDDVDFEDDGLGFVEEVDVVSKEFGDDDDFAINPDDF